MNTDNTAKQHASLFDLDGVPKMSQAIPLALQHVVAMIVGCVTPAIIISGAAGIDTADRVLLIQASLVVSALATLLQLFPIGNKNSFHLGAGLPVQDGRGPGSHQPVRGHSEQGGHVPRQVRGVVRCRPLTHAVHSEGGQRGGVRSPDAGTAR